MGRIIPIVILIALTVYCAVEVAQANAYYVRRMPKWMWAIVVICIPLIGPLAWLFFGRPLRRPPAGDPARGKGPDDDPDFLNSL